MRNMILAAILFAFSALPAAGQEFGVSTNIADYANLGTLNVQASYALSRHWSLAADLKYNPFSYSTREGTVRNRQRSLSAGARYWPWHAYSGWWLSGALRYQEYNTAGLFSDGSTQGDRVGASLGGGYSYMLTPFLNLEVGAGVWSGYDSYAEYDCPDCGRKTSTGQKFFFLPAELVLALTYIF